MGEIARVEGHTENFGGAAEGAIRLCDEGARDGGAGGWGWEVGGGEEEAEEEEGYGPDEYRWSA